MEITLELVPVINSTDFSRFCCGNGIIDNEVSTNAYFYNLSREATSFAIMLNGGVIGCAIIGLTTIEAQPLEENVEKFYAIEIRVLAITQQEQGKHYGSIVLDGLIAQAKECADFCGCRYLVLTSVPDRISWYEQRGFATFPDKNYNNKMFIDFRNIQAYNEYADQ